ncbi:hypothetical protein FHR87_002438 [Azomonas macrocytogenes]|uniref:Uncharacterized protein n=1 Tax=Azomonas macrocytogenes TaxID=69962 RepID=A0A839T4M5_AZOMA|nr:hypothetical protein [Azomonas macrocytogenes]
METKPAKTMLNRMEAAILALAPLAKTKNYNIINLIANPCIYRFILPDPENRNTFNPVSSGAYFHPLQWY